MKERTTYKEETRNVAMCKIAGIIAKNLCIKSHILVIVLLNCINQLPLRLNRPILNQNKVWDGRENLKTISYQYDFFGKIYRSIQHL